MFLLPVVLVVLGISVIIWAVKMDNSSSSENLEILAVLKGVASVKMELKQIQSEFQKTESKIQGHEQRIVNYEDNLSSLNSELQRTKKLIEDKISPGFTSNNHSKQEDIESVEKKQKTERYHEVLQLSNEGYSVVEIASRLSLSQDAVLLALKTAQRRDVI